MTRTAEQIVGRRAELEALDTALSELQRGRPAALELVGEPGIGKTRLLAELAARAEDGGRLVLSGSASELEIDLPFWVFVDALDEYVESLPPRSLDAMEADARAQLGHVLPALGPRPAGAAVERFRIHRAARELLETLAAGKPLVLVLDDLHWADSGSIDLLATLLRRPPDAAVLLALAVRPRQIPERLRGALERAFEAGTLTRLDLEGLSASEARELLGDAAQADRVFAESGGNPFYMQQLGRFPDARTVAAALAEELAALDDGARGVLQGAAVAGDPFEPELAAAAAGVGETEALAALDELLAADLVRPTDVPRRFRFRHPLVRSAVYDRAPGGWRLVAHERCGAALATRGASAEARAHHVEHAGRHGDEAAIAVLSEAAEAVIQRTPGGAVRWYGAALRLLPADAPAERRMPLMLASANALAAAGRFAEAHATLVECEALAAPEAGAQRAELIAGLSLVDGLMGRHDRAQERLQSAVAALDGVPDPQALVLVMQLANSEIYRQTYDRACAAAERAHEISARIELPVAHAATGALLALAHALDGRMAEAAAHRDEAAALLDPMPDEEVAAAVAALSQLASAEAYLDRLDEGVAHLRRALAIARATGQVQLFPSFAPTMGWLLTLSGRPGEAAELLDGAGDAARLTGSPHAMAWVLFARTIANLDRGDLQAALADGEESIELCREIDESSIVRCFSGATYGLALVEAGELERGLEVAAANADGPLMSRFAAVSRPFFLDRLVPAHLALGRRDDAERCAEEAQRAADATGLRFGAAAARRARAAIALHDGDAAAAAEHAIAAAEINEEIGALVQTGLSRTLAGRALAAAGDADGGREQLHRAAAQLDECGALRYRDAAEMELGKLGVRKHRRTRAGQGDGTGVDALTERELQVARLIVDRRTNAEIAAELFLSRKTVETHIRNLFHKLGVSSRVDVARAVERADRERLAS
ncbi:MAG TPA: AAA family ATPase [Solirubrobacteraceae bacterium]